MKYSRAALRRGAPRPQNAEARGRQARAAASADKTGPRRGIGGQGRPAPRSAAAAPARPHAYYISPFTLCQAPFFGFIPRALPDLLRPFMAFPCPFAAFSSPFSSPRGGTGRGGGRAKRVRRGRDGGRAKRARRPPQGAAERAERSRKARPAKSRAAARAGCRLVLYPLYSEAGTRCAPRRPLPVRTGSTRTRRRYPRTTG